MKLIDYAYGIKMLEDYEYRYDHKPGTYSIGVLEKGKKYRFIRFPGGGRLVIDDKTQVLLTIGHLDFGSYILDFKRAGVV